MKECFLEKYNDIISKMTAFSNSVSKALGELDEIALELIRKPESVISTDECYSIQGLQTDIDIQLAVSLNLDDVLFDVEDDLSRLEQILYFEFAFYGGPFDGEELHIGLCFACNKDIENESLVCEFQYDNQYITDFLDKIGDRDFEMGDVIDFFQSFLEPGDVERFRTFLTKVKDVYENYYHRIDK